MTIRQILYSTVAAIGIAACAVAVPAPASAQQAVAIDNDDIGGVVTGPKGPEAGVWVIAETTDLPTKFTRIVVTDDQGRYVLPDLPVANYQVWVRGYGLVDSPKSQSAPGRNVNLTAVKAPNAKAAAEYYPAGYWFSLLQVPAASEFPGTGPTGNGIATNFQNQAQLLRVIKSGGCWACHQLGSKGTREIPASLGTFESHAAAWDRRVDAGYGPVPAHYMGLEDLITAKEVADRPQDRADVASLRKWRTKKKD